MMSTQMKWATASAAALAAFAATHAVAGPHVSFVRTLGLGANADIRAVRLP